MFGKLFFEVSIVILTKDSKHLEIQTGKYLNWRRSEVGFREEFIVELQFMAPKYIL